tara:strand:+ start:624 stop:728 length:105 start_codon:yes stop_codon:yes gene_type:complete
VKNKIFFRVIKDGLKHIFFIYNPWDVIRRGEYYR